MTPDQKRTMFRVAVLVSPLLLVRLVATLANAGPQHAAAMSSETSSNPAALAPLQTVSEQAPLPEQAMAIERLRALRMQAIGSSPFFIMATAGDDKPKFAASQIPAFSVSAIMVTGSVTRALIDGQLLGVGDEVAPGCVITEIDNEAHAVTVRCTRTGETATRSVDLLAD